MGVPVGEKSLWKYMNQAIIMINTQWLYTAMIMKGYIYIILHIAHYTIRHDRKIIGEIMDSHQNSREVRKLEKQIKYK